MSAWVSWFVDGKAQHFPADSPTGGQILEQLTAAGFVPAGESSARTVRRRGQQRGAIISRKVARGANVETAVATADEEQPLYGKRTGTCTAPKALFPNQQCGKAFPMVRQGQKYCSEACRKRAVRARNEVSTPSPTGVAISPDIRSHLPGVPEREIDLTVAISSVTGAEPAS